MSCRNPGWGGHEEAVVPPAPPRGSGRPVAEGGAPPPAALGAGTRRRFTARRGGAAPAGGASAANARTSAFCAASRRSASSPPRREGPAGAAITTAGFGGAGVFAGVSATVICASSSAAKSSSLPLDDSLISRGRAKKWWCRSNVSRTGNRAPNLKFARTTRPSQLRLFANAGDRHFPRRTSTRDHALEARALPRRVRRARRLGRGRACAPAGARRGRRGPRGSRLRGVQEVRRRGRGVHQRPVHLGPGGRGDQEAVRGPGGRTGGDGTKRSRGARARNALHTRPRPETPHNRRGRVRSDVTSKNHDRKVLSSFPQWTRFPNEREDKKRASRASRVSFAQNVVSFSFRAAAKSAFC